MATNQLLKTYWAAWKSCEKIMADSFSKEELEAERKNIHQKLRLPVSSKNFTATHLDKFLTEVKKINPNWVNNSWNFKRMLQKVQMEDAGADGRLRWKCRKLASDLQPGGNVDEYINTICLKALKRPATLDELAGDELKTVANLLGKSTRARQRASGLDVSPKRPKMTIKTETA